MLNLSSLLISKKNVKDDGNNSSENEVGGNNDVSSLNNDCVKIKLINMQEYKTKKLLDERKNVNVWSANNKKDNDKKEKKKEKKKEQPKKKESVVTKPKAVGENDTKKIENKDIENKNVTPKKLFVPSAIKQQQQKEALKNKQTPKKEEELFPDLIQSKKSNKTEKEKKKTQPAKKSKKEKADKKVQESTKEQENEFPQIEEIEKIHFNIFDFIDMEKQTYEHIVRNSEKVLQKYKNRSKFVDSMIMCN
ncbi:50S ribosomal protein L29 [Plasmodium falciparum IGH-CR14]|uniref:Uncharacterized protein n=5 Tax=Plasmodium falciparum TaxID=5833 RepID=A0A024VKP7_PLAFA|nr:hypothetical protein PFFVO_02519 [Plasmodium falciparum Vietnam Oak-Knoll (FVO)]ETW28436.1 hypothetical protein PFFCH_04068 [Plasmodium falciparum FCH/4]ETW43166.1 hypothetical protein PFNF135_02640 [Plasmodium falciparum NF135/5.C10]EUR72463.1 hypothetical protein PFBG_02554 [Plasmodium falciparum 7G8]KNG74517.1 50S ribosomal protein L29 [Plasmodium falciparum IGH-CR14]SOS78452.1 conserved Plasmodium protein, unknown function [Plasmodium sp. gorilla clade G1]